jgi:hypothetical protein
MNIVSHRSFLDFYKKHNDAEVPLQHWYKTALARIEELLPLVTDETSKEDRRAIELKIMSDIVIEYEEHLSQLVILQFRIL